jgi:hypothetical protein
MKYRGHKGLHSLSMKLEHVIRELEKRRTRGHVATKEIIKRLHELNGNLKGLSKEWHRNSAS